MLKLLLDEHFSPEIARQVKQRRPEIQVEGLQSWENGCLLKATDETILSLAAVKAWSFVTRDQRTIRPLVEQWFLTGRDHGGVIFVTGGALSPRDIGGMVRALINLWDSSRQVDWTNRTVYLGPAAREA